MAVASGLLLTGSFPKAGFSWLAWFALVPLLGALTFRNNPAVSAPGRHAKESFYLGFLAGCVHYLTLLYWIAHTMNTYGHLPVYLCVPVLFIFSAYLALYLGIFSMVLARICKGPGICLFIMAPLLWVSLEYIRSFLLSGFPWELIGYSQHKILHLIQISDIFGVYGVSFLIIMSNGMFFLVFLFLKNKDQRETKLPAGYSILVFALLFGLALFYGKWRIASTDSLISASQKARVSIVQGNIDQSEKWDERFRSSTTHKYIKMSLSAEKDKPDLVVWPETSTPFYFQLDFWLSELVRRGIRESGAYFLIGSPSYIRRKDYIEYYNSAYLIDPDGKNSGKYDKVHLVPFGEYVPFKRWLPFLGKIVAHVGDFRPGEKGDIVTAKLRGSENLRLGVLICYEIIFPSLSGAMAENSADLLVNITNDAWYGRSSAPYQHFSMAVFRAVENKRSLVRSANTGISGFIDPVGRVIASTSLFEDAVITRPVPVIREKTFYTCFGDLFAMICLGVTLLVSARFQLKTARDLSTNRE
ncbi:MAG: apolipoprotein N-acyltransferase [Desulfobacteraceae bacterium]|nr:apolipoprotein N-acyltransferase [Desulfobacteraceae bacterium]